MLLDENEGSPVEKLQADEPFFRATLSDVLFLNNALEFIFLNIYFPFLKQQDRVFIIPSSIAEKKKNIGWSLIQP